jgi:uncharacterized RDD family membrane protein YckC
MVSSRDGRFGVSLDVTLDLPLASLGSRALAQLVDSCLLAVVQLAVAGAAGLAYLALGFSGIDDVGTWPLVAFVVVMFCIQWGWFAAWELGWEGQTPGKRLLGLRVVADDGAAAGTVAILVRNLLRTVDFLPGGYCLGMVVMFLNPQSKRVGDLAGGTVVVVEGRGRSGPVRAWPEGLSAAEVQVVEAFFAQAATLHPERRHALAARLIARLGDAHPELVRGAPEDPVSALHGLFPPEP